MTITFENDLAGPLFYMLPTIIGLIRNVDREDGARLALVNFFLGWTGVGWIFCLFWAFLKPDRNED